MNRMLPILTVLLVITLLWYVAAVWMNATWVYDQAARANVAVDLRGLIHATLTQERPVLPAPHQVAQGLWDGVMGQAITSKRSLVYHAWVTLSATLLGFVIGTTAGILLAIGIVHNRAMDMSVMPWAIASQTIPILAIAPMIIVVLNSMGVQGLIPKAIISAYLSFFPVVVGMVKGLRAPDAMQLDLMRTYNASGAETLGKLRLPSSLPYLFTSLKVGISASLGRHHRGRVADRGSGGAWVAAAESGQLLRANRADLGGAVRGGTGGGILGGDHRHGRTGRHCGEWGWQGEQDCRAEILAGPQSRPDWMVCSG